MVVVACRLLRAADQTNRSVLDGCQIRCTSQLAEQILLENVWPCQMTIVYRPQVAAQPSLIGNGYAQSPFPDPNTGRVNPSIATDSFTYFTQAHAPVPRMSMLTVPVVDHGARRECLALQTPNIHRRSSRLSRSHYEQNISSIRSVWHDPPDTDRA